MVHLPRPSFPSRLKPSSRSSTSCSSRPETPQVPSPKLDSSKQMQLPPLALRVLGRNLAAKDRGGTSDPYAVLTLGNRRNTTNAISKTLNPVWDACFDFILDHKAGSCSLEVICWDKDRFGKDYLGEFGVDLTEVIKGNRVSWEDQQNEPIWYTLCSSSRRKSKISGEIQLKFGLVEPTNVTLPLEELVTRWGIYVQSLLSRSSVEEQLRDVPAIQSVGMVPSDSDDANLAVNLAQSLTMPDEDESDEVDESEPTSLETEQKKRRRLRIRNIRRKMKPFQLTPSSGSLVGLVFMEVHSITDLPPEKNMTRLSFDMDPFVVVSFGKKTFRTRCLRHTLNPVFNERLICHVYRHEETFKISFRVVDRDKLSGNDFIGEAMLDVQELIQRGPKPNPETGLYHPQWPSGTLERSRQNSNYERAISSSIISPDSNDPDLHTYDLAIELAKKERHEGKPFPVLHIRAKHVPYPALREQFWRRMLRQYDTDDTETISRVELVTMLDSLGSTLKDRTINHFFTRFGVNPEDKGNGQGTHELTIDQVVACLENQITRNSLSTSSLPTTPRGITTPSVQSLPSTKVEVCSNIPEVPGLDMTNESTSSSSDELSPEDSGIGEHVVYIKECPLCHQPRLQSKSEVDIITHLALCASQDWKQVDRLVMGEFVTSSQAQRKWYSKVVSRIATGSYKLGANSANILVQDRLTGQIQEERMSVYVRLGIRLLYKGLRSGTMERKRIRNLLRSLTVKQGKKYDSFSSVREIKSFVAFHQLNIDEVLLPLDQFKTKLKPQVRPCVAPDNTAIAVSPADCRAVVFNKIDLATDIWIKGREFNLERLFGDAYPEEVQNFEGGALGIFRLAPQDYHRFHVPVDGVLGEPRIIEGEYYTVNPMAIRSALDVFGENVRVVVPIDSVSHGRVMVVCVGAMMVGSIIITAKKNKKVFRTGELGYFAYGGSTVLVLFQSGNLVFDEDLVENSNQGLETLIRVGMSIGHHPNTESRARDNIKTNVTKEDLEDASRRIGGSFDQCHAHEAFLLSG